MRQTRKIRNYAFSSRTRLPRWLLLFALVVIVTVQSATTAFSQEEVTPSPTAEQSTSPADTMKSRVLQIHEGAFIEVRLTEGGKLRGRLGDVLNEGFILQTISHNRLVDQEVRFEELQSVRPIDKPMTRDQSFDKNLDRTRKIMGIVLGGVSVGLLIAVAAAR